MKSRLPRLSVSVRDAFTLIELLVVIAVLAILVALAIPATNRIIESARAAECIGHLRQIGAALNSYLGENDMKMPTLKTARASRQDEVPVIDNTLDRYLESKDVFACPADAKFAAATGTSYLWNVTLNGQAVASLNFFNISHEPSRIPLLSDKEGFHPYLEDKVNILYADGHASKELKFSSEN